MIIEFKTAYVASHIRGMKFQNRAATRILGSILVFIVI